MSASATCLPRSTLRILMLWENLEERKQKNEKNTEKHLLACFNLEHYPHPHAFNILRYQRISRNWRTKVEESRSKLPAGCCLSPCYQCSWEISEKYVQPRFWCPRVHNCYVAEEYLRAIISWKSVCSNNIETIKWFCVNEMDEYGF